MTIFPRYVSSRFKDLKVGISSYSEDRTALEVIGNVGVGTTNPDVPVGTGNTAKLAVGVVTSHQVFTQVLSFTSGHETGGASNGSNIAIGNTATGNTLDTTSCLGNYYNISIGDCAGCRLRNNDNILLGRRAGIRLTTGRNNILMGRANNSNISLGDFTGRDNVILGNGNSNKVTSGSFNVSIGYQIGAALTTGECNIILGARSGNLVGAGHRNIVIGAYTAGMPGTNPGDGDDNIFIGSCASPTSTGASNCLVIGNLNKSWIYGDCNYSIGIGITNPSVANVSVADTQKLAAGIVTAHRVYAQVLSFTSGVGPNTTGQTTVAGANIAIGDTFTGNTFNNAVLNYRNISIGNCAGCCLNNGMKNVFIGDQAGRNITDGRKNVVIGEAAVGGNSFCPSATGDENFIVGDSAGFNLTSGSHNIIFGDQSGGFTSTGGCNIFMGRRSGMANITGSGNIMLGQFAGYIIGSDGNGDGNIFIGNCVKSPYTNPHNTLAIGHFNDQWIHGDSNYNVGIGITDPSIAVVGAGSTQKLAAGIVTAYNLFGEGANIAGVTTSKHMCLPNNGCIRFGSYFNSEVNNTITGMIITSNGVSQYIQDQGCNLNVATNLFSVSARGFGDGLFFAKNKSCVALYYCGSNRFATAGTGATVYGRLDSTHLNISGVSTFAGLIDGNGGANIVGGSTIDQLNVTGITTFGGNVSIAGTLTYEDVTNVDSIGIITAGHGLRVTKGGINVTAGISTFGGNIDANGTLDVSGIATFGNNVHVVGKNILIAKGSANDAAANTGGISVASGQGDKTWQYISGNDSWSSSETIRVADDKLYGWADDTNTYIARPSADTISFETGGSERLRISDSGINVAGVGTFNGRVGINTDILRSVPALDINLPQDFSGQNLSYSGEGGVGLINRGNKTFPNASGFRTTLGLKQDIEIGGTQTIDSSSPGGFPQVHGMYNFLIKNKGNVQNVERLQFIGFYNQLQWLDQNTLRQYRGIEDHLYYNGADANGKTSSFLEAGVISLTPEDGKTQTINNVIGKRTTLRAASGIATVTIGQTWKGHQTSLSIAAGSGRTTNAVINNAVFYNTSDNWGTSGSGTKNATIQNLYGLKLNPPSAADGLVINNNYGIYQGWSNASNYFAGNVGVGTTIATNRVGAGNTAKLAVGVVTSHNLYTELLVFSGLRSDGEEGRNIAIGNHNTGNTCTNNQKRCNISMGRDTGCQLNDAWANVLIGACAGLQITDGDRNVAIGAFSMGSISTTTTGGQNFASGYLTLGSLTSGNLNVGLGRGALGYTQTGSYNIGIGMGGGYHNISGNDNIALGRCSGTITSFGGAGERIGDGNIFIGKYSKAPVGVPTSYLVIGNGASQFSSFNEKTNWIIGDSNYNIGLGIGTPTSKLHVKGDSIVTGVATAGIVTATNIFADRYHGDQNNNFYAGPFSGSGAAGITSGATTNVAIGHSVGSNITSGVNNVLLGKCSGIKQTTANSNVFIGSCPGQYVTTGYQNVAIGRQALDFVQTGYNNVAIGYRAGRNQYSASLGIPDPIASIFLGRTSGDTAIQGGQCRNIFIGDDAGDGIIQGADMSTTCTNNNDNILLGSGSGGGLTICGLLCSNVLIGGSAGGSSRGAGVGTDYVHNVLIGSRAGFAYCGSCNVFLGAFAGQTSSSDRGIGVQNIGIGHSVQMPKRVGSNQLAIGLTSQYWITGDELFNVGIGTTIPTNRVNPGNTQRLSVGIVSAYQISASFFSAGCNHTGFGGNIAIGNSYTGNISTTASLHSRVIAIGNNAGCQDTRHNNIFLGDQAGKNLISGQDNIIMGGCSFGCYTSNVCGSNNIVFGENSAPVICRGSHNITMGDDASPLLKYGDDNLGLGRAALAHNISGSRNIALGKCAGRVAIGPGVPGISTAGIGTGNIFIGCRATAPHSNPSNYLVIGNGVDHDFGNGQVFEETTNWIIGDPNFNIGLGIGTPTSKLHVKGDSIITGVATAGIVTATNIYSDQYFGDDNHNFYAGAFVGSGAVGIASGACHNVGIGYSTLSHLTTGDKNVAIGCRTGTLITSAANNVLLGRCAGFCITTGSSNIALGYRSGRCLKTGYSNVNIGFLAGAFADNSIQNIVIGPYAGYAINNAGYRNIAIGAYSGCICSSSTCDNQRCFSQNIFFGEYSFFDYRACHALNHTITMGSCAGAIFQTDHNQCSSFNTIIGGAAAIRGSGCGNVFLGSYANSYNCGTYGIGNYCKSGGNHLIGIGHSVCVAKQFGNTQLAIGHASKQWIHGDSNYSVGIGITNPSIAKVGAGDTQTFAAGIVTAYQISAAFFSAGCNNGFGGNIAIGNSYTGNVISTDTGHSRAIAFGNNAGCQDTGHNNVIIGDQAAKNLGFGDDNIIVGGCAMGKQAGIITGSNNIMMGEDIAENFEFGYGNILFGGDSAYFMTCGRDNIAMGCKSLSHLIEGTNNIALGRAAGQMSSGSPGGTPAGIGTDNIFLGSYATAPHRTPNKYLVIGHGNIFGKFEETTNWIIGDPNYNIGIGIGTPTSKLHVKGSAIITGVATAGIVTATNVFADRYHGDQNNNFYAGPFTGSGAAGITSGATANIGIGLSLGSSISSGSCNMMFGSGGTGNKISTGNNNILLGSCVGSALSTGNCNIAIGRRALQYVTSGVGNIAIGCRAGTHSGGILHPDDSSFTISIGRKAGHNALRNGYDNIFLGEAAGDNILAGYSTTTEPNFGNILIGSDTGKSISPSNGKFRGNIMLGHRVGFFGDNHPDSEDYKLNTLIGFCAGFAQHGNCNIFLGAYSGYIHKGFTNIGIGHSVLMPDRLGSNQLAIGQTSQYWITGDQNFNVGIGTSTPTSKLHVVGNTLVESGVSTFSGNVDINVGSSTTAFNVAGSEGQLFSVTNNLTSGSIFEVNDVSGMPSIDVNADGTIQLAPHGAGELVGIGTTLPTSKLHVVGDTLVTGVSTFKDDVEFHGVLGVSSITFDKSDNSLKFKDNARLRFGDDNRFQIYYKDNVNYIMAETAVDDIEIGTHGGDIIFETVVGSQKGAEVKYNSSVDLYYKNVKRLATSGVGATIYHQLDTTDLTAIGGNFTGIVTASDFIGGGINTSGTSFFTDEVLSGGINISGVSTFAGLVDINAGGQANTFKVEDLTAGRVVLAGTGGELEDNANLTFNGSTLGVTGDASFSGNVSIGGTLTYEDVTNIDSVGLITARSGLKVGTGITFEADGDAYVTGIATLGRGASGEVYLYNPSNSALSATTNDVYGWKAKTYCAGLQVNTTLYLSRSGSNGLSLNYNNATGSHITANSGFLKVGVPYGGDFNLYGNNVYIKDRLQTKNFAHFQKVSGTDYRTHLYGGDSAIKLSTANDGINVTGVTSTTNLNVAGVSTFVGVTTFQSPVFIGAGTTQNSKLLIDKDIEIFSSGQVVRFKIPTSSPNAILTYIDSPAVQIGRLATEYATFNPSQARFKVDNKLRLNVVSDGIEVSGVTDTLGLNVTTGVSTFAGNIDANGNLDVDGHTSLDDVLVTGFTTFFPSGGTKFFTTIEAENGMFVHNAGVSTFKTPVQIDAGATFNQLNLSGVSTFAGDINANGNIVGDDSTNISGINSVTATEYYGTGAIGSKLFARDAQNNLLAGCRAGIAITTGDNTAQNNVVIGRDVARRMICGCYNVLMGDNVASRIHRGRYNVMMGNNVGSAFTQGATSVTNNVFIGRCVAISQQANVSNSIAIGSGAAKNGTSNSSIIMGPSAGIGVLGQTHSQNIFLGTNAGTSISTGNSNIALGNGAGRCLCQGDLNIYLGQNAGKCNFRGHCNIALGNHALYGANSGQMVAGRASANIALGVNAGYSLSTGDQNFLVGVGAGQYLVAGSHNVAIGNDALKCATTPSYNIALGQQAARNVTTGVHNLAFGFCALFCTTTGGCNFAFGNRSLNQMTTGCFNVSMGGCAGQYMTDGCRNIFLGDQAACCFISGNNNIALGCRICVPLVTGSNQLAIGNRCCYWLTGDSSYNVGIGSTTPQDQLDVGGTIRANGLNVSGVSTFSGKVNIGTGLTIYDSSIAQFADNIGLSFGTDNDTVITHKGSSGTQIEHTGQDDLRFQLGQNQIVFEKTNGDNFMMMDHSGGYVRLYHNNVTRLQTTVSGVDITGGLSVTGITTFTGNINANGNIIGDDSTNISGINTVGANFYYGCGGTGSRLFVQDAYRNLIAGANAGLAITTTFSPGALSNILLGCHAGSRIRSQCYTVAIGVNAGKCIAAGSGQDTFVGSNSGQRAGCCGGSGNGNAFFGYGSGICGYDPTANTYLGYHAGKGHPDSTGGTGGSCNVAVGYHAGSNIRAGSNNVLIGRYVGTSNSTASNNIAMGNHALFCNLSGSGNISLGSQSMEKNITGYLNVGISCNALFNNTTGTFNIAIGHNSLYCNSTTSNNIAIGCLAGYKATCGPNIMIGAAAGCLLNGCRNVMMGQGAGTLSTESTGNTFVGYAAGACNSIGDNNTSIGCKAGIGYTTGCSNISVGYNAGAASCGATGSGNLSMGHFSGKSISSAQCNIIIGECAGCDLTSGGCNIVIGQNAGKKLQTSSDNIAIGRLTASFNNVTGNYNVMFGNRAGSKLTSGSQNAFIGPSAGRYVTSGARNFAVGGQSSYCLTVGNDNIGIGACSNRCLTIGSDNIAIGRCANYSDTNTWGNIAIGHSAGYHANATNYRENISIGSTAGGGGACNIAIGLRALSNCATTGGYNIAIGGEAGCSISYGDHNVFIGAAAGGGSEGGDCNIGIGVNAGKCNKDGHRNISIGHMTNFCSEHSMCNVAVGHQAQFKIETASHNVALGNQAARCLETSHGNVSIGQSAAYGLKGGSNNVSIGSSSGAGSCLGTDGATGDDNIYIGKFSGSNITTGHTNVFLGPYAGRSSASSSANNNIGIGMNVGKCLTTGFNNIFFGKNAGLANTGGKANIFMGLFSGQANAGGSNNHFIGGLSGMSNITGKQNNFFGFYAGAGNTSGNYNIFFGTAAGICNTTGSCTIAIGQHAAKCQTTANATIAIGHCAGAGNTITGSDNILVGKSAGFAITTAFNNIFMGVCAGANTGIGTEMIAIGTCAGLCNTDGNRNVFIGYEAGKCSTTGVVNVAIGNQAGCAYTNNNTNVSVGPYAGKKLCSGSGNVLLGAEAGICINTGGCNAVIGRNAGKFIISGSWNNVFGHFAGCKLSSGSYNLLMGNCAGYCLTGHGNVMLGHSSGFNRSGNKYCRNVLIGQSVGSSAGTLADGNYDVLIGYNAGCNYTGSCSIGIGHSVCLPIADGMNQLAIGHYEDRWIVGTCDFNVGIGITTPTSKLHVGGDAVVSGVVTATDFDATSDIRLKTNIQPIDDPIAKVIQIEGVSFNWKKDNQPALGVIADQVEKILPELVHGDDPKTVNYNGLIGLLIEVVKDQQKQINTLSERISKLE